MFTGLVECMAQFVESISETSGVRLVLREPGIAGRSKVGDSIALNGCCLTVVEVDGDRLAFQAGQETLSRTNLGQLQPGDLLNVEKSLRLGDELGGHLVTGHIDAVGTLDARNDDGEWCTMWFRAPRAIMGQVASKGSIAVDGISLTLVDVEEERFSVALIPHTLEITTLGRRNPGDQVNLETDVLAKYVEKGVKAILG